MDLQLALLLIGAIVVAAVALSARGKGGFGKSFRRGVDFHNAQPITANGGVRQEPSMQLDLASIASAHGDRKFLKVDKTIVLEPQLKRSDPLAEQLESIEEVAHRRLNLNPGFDPPGTGPEAAAADPAAQTLPDEHLDFIVHLPGPGPVSRRNALGIYKQNEYKLEYPRQLYGQRYHTNFWSVLQHDSDATQYGDLKLAIQLIDDRGPIGESELNAFMQVGLKLADMLHRPSTLSMPFEQALARAQDLEKFRDEYDVIAGVNIATEPQTPFKGHAILEAARRVGLEFGAMQIFHAKHDGRTLYSLSNLYKPGFFNPNEWEVARTAGLALFMSVPTVHEPGDVFEQMMQTATMLSTFLAGRLLDQDLRPLTDKGIAAIRAQIGSLDAKMRDYGIVPGSDSARRLFGAGIEG